MAKQVIAELHKTGLITDAATGEKLGIQTSATFFHPADWEDWEDTWDKWCRGKGIIDG